MKLFRQREAAFTLIELMVVIGIIGVLAALLLQAISSVKARAHSTACKNRLHQLSLSLQMYVDDHQGKFPYYRSLPDPAYDTAVGPPNTGFWWAKLLPYYPINWTNAAYHCPGYKGVIKGSTILGGGWTYPDGSYAYNARGVRAIWTTNSVVTNNMLLGLGGKAYRIAQPGRTTGVTSEGQIAAPSKMFAVGESRWKAQGDQGREGGRDFMECGMIGPNRGMAAFDPARHGKNYNQLFCDGHVTAMSPWVLFDPKKTAAMWNYDNQPHAEFWPPF